MKSIKVLATFQIEVFYDKQTGEHEETFFIRRVEPVSESDIKTEIEAIINSELGNPELDRSNVIFNQNTIK